jgi:hypothetical protein
MRNLRSERKTPALSLCIVLGYLHFLALSIAAVGNHGDQETDDAYDDEGDFELEPEGGIPYFKCTYPFSEKNENRGPQM